MTGPCSELKPMPFVNMDCFANRIALFHKQAAKKSIIIIFGSLVRFLAVFVHYVTVI